MTTLSHLAVGYLVAKGFIDHGLLPMDTYTPYIVSMAFANLPDLDALYNIRHLYNHQNHFNSYAHYPINWFLVISLTWGLSLLFHITYLLPYLLLALVDVFLHFFMDTFSIYGGIAWLAPWNKKRYSFITILPIPPSNNKEWTSWYTKHWVMYLEIALWIVSLLLIMGEAKKIGL